MSKKQHHYYRVNSHLRVFDEYSDELFLKAYEWIVVEENKPISFTRFIKPTDTQSPKERLLQWIYENEEMQMIVRLYNTSMSARNGIYRRRGRANDRL